MMPRPIPNLLEVLTNHVFITAMLGWGIAQSIKVCLGVVREHRFDFRWFVGTGGMPSAHAAGVSALASSVALDYGFGSPLFGITCVFAMITMFDAQGVRRASGLQARILNKMLDDIHAKRGLREERIKEFLGHTPIEVFVGAFLGLLIALITA